MNPLAVEIWFSIAIAYVLVSLTMWIVARFSPFEWNLVPNHPNDNDLCNDNNHIKKNNENLEEKHFHFCDYEFDDADDDDSDGFYDIDHEYLHEIDKTELLCIENDFTLRNSFWFTIGSLMQQGSDLSPKVVIYLFFLLKYKSTVQS